MVCLPEARGSKESCKLPASTISDVETVKIKVNARMAPAGGDLLVSPIRGIAMHKKLYLGSKKLGHGRRELSSHVQLFVQRVWCRAAACDALVDRDSYFLSDNVAAEMFVCC